MTMRTSRLVLALAAALAVSGCGLVDAFIFPIGLLLGVGGAGEGGSCQSAFDCGDPDATELVCDSVDYNDGTCVHWNEVDQSRCDDAVGDLDDDDVPGDLLIFDASASFDVTDAGDIINARQVCIFGSFTALDINDALPSSLDEDGASRLELATNSGAPIRPSDRNFHAEASYDDMMGVYYVFFEDCFVEAMGTGEIPNEYAVQLFRDDIPSNILCMPSFED